MLDYLLRRAFLHYYAGLHVDDLVCHIPGKACAASKVCCAFAGAFPFIITFGTRNIARYNRPWIASYTCTYFHKRASLRSPPSSRISYRDCMYNVTVQPRCQVLPGIQHFPTGIIYFTRQKYGAPPVKQDTDGYSGCRICFRRRFIEKLSDGG